MEWSQMKSYKFTSFDGIQLAIHEMGEGRPLVLLHGLFSHAEMNWIKFGHAAKLANAGYRVIMPNFRAHGQSDAPHDPAAYPQDILVTDMLSLLDYLALKDFDLGGFSLGARTTAKLLCAGIKPHRAILMGMGWEGLIVGDGRREFFMDAINMRDSVKREDPHFMAVQFFKSQKIDPVAALLLLQSFGPMQIDDLTGLDLPISVICGVDDHDNGSAPLLVSKLRNAQYFEVPGTHMSSVAEGALGDAIIASLANGDAK
jgi:pimeloyl-ACP methyl ester carboxylesterase